MRARRVLCSGIAVALAGCLVVIFWPAHPAPPPLVLAIQSIEPSGMFDDTGAELRLIYFTISNGNPTNQPGGLENRFYVKDAGRVVEAKVDGRWKGVQGTSAMSGSGVVGLAPGRQYESLFLAPIGTDCCRVWLKYAGPATLLTLKGVSESVVSRLPISVRSRISYKFWRWVGFPRSEPSADWREISVELPLHPALSEPASTEGSGGTHNKSLQPR